MSKNSFNKFINKDVSGAKKKEMIRQEKKKVRAEKKAWFEEKKNKEFEQRNNNSDRPKFDRSLNDSPKSTRSAKLSVVKKEKKSFTADKPRFESAKNKTAPEKPRFQSRDRIKSEPTSTYKGSKGKTVSKKTSDSSPQKDPGEPVVMPLNKFISWSCLCARRVVAELIKQGKVTVNGEKVLEPPFRVASRDEVKVNGKKLTIRKNLVYILLNKPKDYITTMDDPEGRSTVMELINGATDERVFPVGRLDRNTTGVLLLTNDGELAQKMTHPSYEVKKLYEVRLDKPLTKQDFDSVLKGIELEDGFIRPDALAYADHKDKAIIGIEIHSGRNRIVRRIFESLGYKIKNLDRVMYGNFTKKNIERGKWRFLSEKEIRLLKHMHPKNSIRRIQAQG